LRWAEVNKQIRDLQSREIPLRSGLFECLYQSKVEPSRRCSRGASADGVMIWIPAKFLREDVTPRSEIPHGTIIPKYDRSGAVLNARPCIVTQRLQRMPIAQILRSGPRASGPTHTPVRPSERPAGRHRAPNTSGLQLPPVREDRRGCPERSGPDRESDRRPAARARET
jgi:hypothetical protein